MTTRLFRDTDAEEVAALIARTLREVNSRDYTPEYIEETVASMPPEELCRRAAWMHFYVVEEAGALIGCGAIGPYWGREDESSLFNIFVLPEHQGRGVGRAIIDTLEADEFFLRAKRVEIPASITATPFYLRMGYDYKGGVTIPDDRRLLRLEKHR